MIHFYCKGYFLPTKFVIFYDLQARQFFLILSAIRKVTRVGWGIYIYIYIKKDRSRKKEGKISYTSKKFGNYSSI